MLLLDFSLTFTFFISLVGSKVDSCLNVKVKIEIGDGEPIESAIRRFKREVNKSGREYKGHSSGDACFLTSNRISSQSILSLLLPLPEI